VRRGVRQEILKLTLKGANKLTQIIISDPKRWSDPVHHTGDGRNVIQSIKLSKNGGIYANGQELQ